jgi:hypothetical protein
MTEQVRQPVRQAARGGTLIITNLFKLAGLGIAVREVLRPDRDAAVLALSAFMMSGAQLSEEFLLGIIERFLGSSTPEPETAERRS